MPGLSNPFVQPLTYLRYQRNYMWDVLLPDVGINLGGLAGFGVAQLVQEVSFGDYSITEASIMRYGPYQASFAGLFTVTPIKMTFLKMMPDMVSAYFNAWKGLIIDQNGLYYPKSHYQKTIYVRFNDQSSIAIGQYKFIGAYPTKYPDYSLSYDSNKVTTVNVEFTVDKIEYELF
jgi:hypothetical protein